MILRRGWLVVAAALLLPLAPAPAAAQPDVAAVARAAGIDLPARLCGLVRREIGAHPQAEGVIASYASPDAWIDVFIVRVQQSLDEDFTSSATVTGRLTPNLTEAGNFAAPPGIAGARGQIWRGTRNNEELLTGLLLWHRGGWRTKVLASAFPGRGGPGWSGIECAVRALSAGTTV